MRKKEELKESERRIFVAAAAVIFFLLLFLATMEEDFFRNNQTNEEDNRPLSELTPEEKIAVAEKENQAVLDPTNYNRALLYGDRSYCENIKDEDLKKECISKTPEPDPNAIEPEIIVKSDEEVLDQTNFNRAKLYGDSEYCDRILETSLKEECFSLFR